MEDTFDSCQFDYTYLPMHLSQFINEKIHIDPNALSFLIRSIQSILLASVLTSKLFKFGVTKENHCESSS